MKPTDTSCQPITLARTGQPPLKFNGELVAESNGERDRTGKELSRYHNLYIYQTDMGKYLVYIAYRSAWQGELYHNHAEIAPTASAVAAILCAYDPCSRVQGYPPQEAYKTRQERLLADLRAAYEAQISEILADDRFAEVI